MRAIAAVAPATLDAAAPFPHVPLRDPAKRDVHIIVVESFIDPRVLDGFRFAPSPLSGTMKAVLDDPDRWAFGPVLGGRSPDAEFEVLCGVAALLDWRAVVFNALNAKALDCLPRDLGRHGWRTVATNPIDAHFFNTRRVYELMGFAEERFAADMDMADMDGRYLSAEAALAQHLDRVRRARQAGGPVFSYVFPAASHLPYVRDETKRPAVIATDPADALVAGYANALFYMLRAVEAHVAALFRLDPDALVVIVGDHPPYLGPEHAAARGGAARFEVPLIVYDGAGNPLPVGRLTHFEIPALIAALLTPGAACPRLDCAAGDGDGLRPLAVGGFAFARHGGTTTACGGDPAVCSRMPGVAAAHVRHLLGHVQ